MTSPSPSSPAPSGDNSGSGSNGEGCSGPYIENYWDDNCMLAALSGIYAQYRFFNGTVAADLEEGDAGRQRAQKRLEGFLPKFILNTGWRNANLFTALGGIHFLPVDKHVYLQLHRLVSEAEDRYRDSVLATSVLYGDHLVWSGLEQQDVRVLYKMLTSHLCTRSSEYPFFFSDVYENLRNPGCSVITPGIRIFLGPNVPTSEDKKEKAKAEVRPATLVIYRHQQLLFAFVLRQGCEAAPEGFFDFLRAQLEGSVLPVALGEHYDRKTAFDTQYKYIYFNQMNLALKTSLQGKGEDIDPQTMETLKRMHDEFEHSQDAVCEVLVRSFNDRWIVGRCSEKREFYVIFDAAKGASLTEINEEVKKLSAQYFQSIFITE